MTNPSPDLNPIANRVARAVRGDDPQLLCRLPSGYAILANQQPDPINGCCMLLPDLPLPNGSRGVPASLNDLAHEHRAMFLTDLALLGDAVQAATGCLRLNYLILCNQVPWLHGHVVPRFATEVPDKFKLDPFAAYDFPNARKADATAHDRDLHARLKAELEKLL